MVVDTLAGLTPAMAETPPPYYDNEGTIHGSHNDIVIYTVPGAKLEATGGSNDITWKQIRRGPPPILRAWGSREEFYRNSRSSSQKNHDWYQEVR